MRKPNLYVHFCTPTTLLRLGAQVSQREHFHAQGARPFICNGQVELDGLWWYLLVPCFSRPTPYRTLLPPSAKRGDEAWVNRDTAIDLRQLWLVPLRALDGSRLCGAVITEAIEPQMHSLRAYTKHAFPGCRFR
ncbi:MAG: hypothetical protein RBU37_18995 [Myxococcota bacterium]|nr:hypothetical protein [Myxococcota bacterium]